MTWLRALGTLALGRVAGFSRQGVAKALQK